VGGRRRGRGRARREDVGRDLCGRRRRPRPALGGPARGPRPAVGVRTTGATTDYPNPGVAF
jgi:hypothetical protein